MTTSQNPSDREQRGVAAGPRGAAAGASSGGASSGKTRSADVTMPSLGVAGTVRFFWRQLTSMQTALFLLLLLAVAAVPGSLLPQRSVNPSLTQEFLDENGRWGEFLDAIGGFNVFSSVWFSAIYLLLFISLIGCIVPRVVTHAKQLRSQPPKTPARLTRFVGYHRSEHTGADPSAILEQARRSLAAKRYRLRVLDDAKGARSVSAERGYLRETGNLLFHIALVGVLIGVAGGHLLSYHGQISVVEEEGFANSLTKYDSFTPGPWFDTGDLPDFRFELEDFRATYDTTPDPRRFGQPTSFEADVAVTYPGEEAQRQTVQVNKPISVPGADVFLLGNGYAPEITLTDAEGTVVAEGPLITIPSGDVGYTSQVILKAPDASPDQLALVGYFLPTGVIDDMGPRSEYPDLVDPQLVLTAYTGDLGLDEGVPRNAYQIDITELEPVTGEDGNQTLIRLYPGQTFELANGATLSFDGVKRFAAFDIRHDPFEAFTLISALAATLGLILSLFIPRRRVWVRVTPTESGTVLEVAGLARSEDYRLQDDMESLHRALAPTPNQAANTAPTPAEEQS